MSINKKYIIISLLLLGVNASFCFSQDSTAIMKRARYNEYFQKGKYMVGLNFFYTPLASSTNWTTTGQAGYFIANKWVGGVQLTTYGDKSTYDRFPNGLYSKSSQFSISPEIYTRYYISSSRFRPFVQLSAGYKAYSSTKTLTGTEQQETIKSNGMTYGGAIGISYQAAKSVNIELLYNHQYFKKKRDLGDMKLRLGVTVLLK